MGDPPESVVRKFCAAFADPTPDRLAGFFSADAEYVDGPRGAHHGVDAIKTEMHRQLAMGYGPVTVDIKKLVADGPTVMAERVDSFRLGGKTFAMETAGVFEIDGDGHIQRFRDYYDLKTITDQLEAAGFTVPA